MSGTDILAFAKKKKKVEIILHVFETHIIGTKIGERLLYI